MICQQLQNSSIGFIYAYRSVIEIAATNQLAIISSFLQAYFCCLHPDMVLSHATLPCEAPFGGFAVLSASRVEATDLEHLVILVLLYDGMYSDRNAP